MIPDQDFVKRQIDQIQRVIAKQKRKHVTIVAVSKNQPIEAILPFLKSGHKHFGENRFAEASNKYMDAKIKPSLIEKKICLHYLGPVQSGNARQIPRLFQYVHSVGDWKNLRILEKIAQRERIKKDTFIEFPIQYFLQLNLANEKNKKNGFLKEELLQVDDFPSNDFIHFAGLMTMGVFDDLIQTKEIFHKTKCLRDQIAPGKELSMGMSNDWKIALEYETNWLRIGTFLFGTRTSI